MCVFLAYALAAAGTLYSGLSNAAAQRGNAAALDQQAGQERAAANANEQRQRTRNQIILAQRRTGTGASGFTSDGSGLDVLEFEARQTELDALTIRYQGEVNARGLEFQAGQARRAATASTVGAILGAGGTLLAGGAKQWGWFNTTPGGNVPMPRPGSITFAPGQGGY